MEGSQFCFTHDPAKAAEREAASQRGGQTRAEQLNGAVLPSLTSAGEVTAYLEKVTADVERGLMDPRRAKAISCVARAQLLALRDKAREDYYGKLYGHYA